MEHKMNPATMAEIVAGFGREGYWPANSGTSVVEFVLDHDEHNPLIVVRCDIANSTMSVHFGGRIIEVTSAFNNGSGFFFRSEGTNPASEFMHVDHQFGAVVLNGRTIRTPRKERENLADALVADKMTELQARIDELQHQLGIVEDEVVFA